MKTTEGERENTSSSSRGREEGLQDGHREERKETRTRTGARTRARSGSVEEEVFGHSEKISSGQGRGAASLRRLQAEEGGDHQEGDRDDQDGDRRPQASRVRSPATGGSGEIFAFVGLCGVVNTNQKIFNGSNGDLGIIGQTYFPSFPIWVDQIIQ